MHEELARDCDRELGRPGEISLSGFARSMKLREHDLLFGAELGSPRLHPALEGAQLPLLVAARILLDEHVEERLRLEPW